MITSMRPQVATAGDQREAGASADASRIWLVRVRPEQAEYVHRYLSAWLDRLRAAGARKVVIDLSRARRLELAAFGEFLAKVRDVLGIPVDIVEVPGHLAESLRQLDLLNGARIVRSGRSSSAPEVFAVVQEMPRAHRRSSRPETRAA